MIILVFYQDRLDADWDLRILNGEGLTVNGLILFVRWVNDVFDCAAAPVVTALCGVPDGFCLIPTGSAQFASPDGPRAAHAELSLAPTSHLFN